MIWQTVALRKAGLSTPAAITLAGLAAIFVLYVAVRWRQPAALVAL